MRKCITPLQGLREVCSGYPIPLALSIRCALRSSEDVVHLVQLCAQARIRASEHLVFAGVGAHGGRDVPAHREGESR